MTDVRRATRDDAEVLARPKWDFNTEFETEVDDVAVLTARFARLLVLDPRRRLAAGKGSPEMHINVDEVDLDTRRLYERHGFVNIEEGADFRMLSYVGPTAAAKAETSSSRHSES